MSESWCGTLLFVLVPLVTALNAVLIAQMNGLRSQVQGRRSGDPRYAEGAEDG